MLDIIKKEEKFPPPAKILEYGRVYREEVKRLPMPPSKITEMGKLCLDYVKLSLDNKLSKTERLEFYAHMAEAYPEYRSEWLHNARWVEDNC